MSGMHLPWAGERGDNLLAVSYTETAAMFTVQRTGEPDAAPLGKRCDNSGSPPAGAGASAVPRRVPANTEPG